MAQQGVALGGAAAGALIGTAIPGVGWVLGAQIGFAVGSVVGAALFPQKGPKPEKGDLIVQAASYGVPISILAGTDKKAADVLPWVKGNEIERREQGGKGGMMGGGAVTYQFFASFAVIIGEGPIDGVRRIWADTKLIYDKSAASLDEVLADGGQSVTSLSGISGDQRVYLGTETQLPDPAIQADRGADNVSAMRGLAYVVFEDLPLANFANRIPNISIEYVKDGTLVYRNIDLTATAPGSVGADSPGSPHSNFDPYAPYIWNAVQGGNLTKFNTVSRTCERQRDVEVDGVDLGAGAPVADEFGNVYAVATVSALPVAFYRFDASTLVKTGQATTNAVSPPNYLTYRSFLAGSDRYLVATDVLGGVHLYDAATMAQLAARLNAGAEAMVDISPDRVIYVAQSNTINSFLRVITLTATPSGTFPYAMAVDTDYDLTSTHGGDLQYVHYYADEGVLLLAGDGVMSKVDPATGTVLASLSNVASNVSALEFRRGPLNGKIWGKRTTAAGNFVEIDVASFTVLREIAPAQWASSGGTKLDCAYDPWSDSLIAVVASNQGLRQLFLPRIDPLDVDRADVLSDYATRCGLTTSQLDLTRVLDSVQGNTVRRQTTGRDCSEPIMQSGFVDTVDVDAQIRYVPRGQSVTLTVPEDDLGAALWGENNDAQKLTETIPQEINRPERVLIRHPDREAQYDTNAQAAKRSREIIRSREQMTFDTSEVMSADTAMRLAERLLYSLWAEYPVRFSLPPKYRKLIPTDVITILVGALSFRVRITKIDDGPYLECEGMVEEPATYVSTALGGETNIPSQVLQLLSPTQLFLIDSNLIRDEDDNGGHYLGIAPTVPDGLWSGAQIHKSSDGIAFQAASSFTDAVDWGVAEHALANHHCTTTDRYNTLTVQMVREEAGLASCTDLEMRNGANAFLLQSGTDWELIQAADITDLGGGRYELATMLRGMRGTEQQASGHAGGDKLIVLSIDTMHRIVSDSEIDLARYYKATTFGVLFAATGAVTFTNTARGRECYAPAHIDGTRDGSDNLTITWKRRNRLFGEIDWNDGVTDVPMSEDDEEYEVVIPDAVPPRTISVTAETASYSASDQTSDGFTPGDPIDIIIYQLSAVNGRGRPAEATV